MPPRVVRLDCVSFEGASALRCRRHEQQLHHYQRNASDGGGYRVIVANPFGVVTSRVAQLSVSFLDIRQYAGITILGVPGKTYRVEAAPEAGGGWSTLTNLVLPHTPFIWIDYESPNVAARVYRAAELQ